MAPLGLLIAACSIPPVCVACIAVLLWRKRTNIPRPSAAECRPSLHSPTGSDLAAEGYLPTTGQPGDLQVFDGADSKDQRASPEPQSYASMRSAGPRIAIAQNGTRVLARKSATERRLVERARKDKNRFGVGAQDSTEFEIVPTLNDYFSQWAEPGQEANVDSAENRHPNGLRRRSVTWTPQRLDHFSLSGYLPPSLRPSFEPSSAALFSTSAFARSAEPGLLLLEGDPSSTGCSGDSAKAQGSSESAEVLIERRRPDHAKDSSFGTDLFQALGLDGGSRSSTAASASQYIAQLSGLHPHGATLTTSGPPGESPGSVSRLPLTDLPSRKAPDQPARPGVGDIVDFSERSTEPSRKQASEMSQHSMLSLSRWEAYGQVQDALQHLPPCHHGEPVETLLNDVDESGLVSPRRKNSVPWFATNAPADSIGQGDNGDSESEIEAARLQEQRSAERMFEHARRPISWLPRQSSSGTLPGIASLVEKLEISNPDERSQRGASASSADVTQEILVHAR